MPLLPEIDSKARYRELVADEARWRPGLRVIAARHGLAFDRLERAKGGTHIVYLDDRVVVKLFVPLWADDALAERAMLAHVAGRLSIATPGVLGEGELEGWPYLVLERVPGSHLSERWSSLDQGCQRSLIAQLGALAASLHALALPELEAAMRADWQAFLATRREQLVDKQREDGLSPAWIADIEAAVTPALLAELGEAKLAALHMDLHHDHLMVQDVDGALTLSGLFDFGDAMFGACEHELIAPLAFMATMVPGGARALLRGYGYAERELDEGLASRLTGQLLLQRHCRLSGVLARLGRGQAPPEDLAALLARLWDFRGCAH
ncbi:phosphotransferase [Pseudenhygromyxa sp. WMMC2535]|uniref:phosphotransferase n=1 Tax=Pseudenhygromyxa sp. WMMC2535 TaxID=2712867 RepID=UPI00155537FE|nr:phosphotransferase [Pseudenhygromyxa sp. WMMC2535]NVB42982.1 phosphotransferase [Pseudenhygromyxa sp. WMMC2535]